MILRNFIVFEGIDGSGTSTQLTLLRKRQGTERFLFTAEPSSAATGTFLRQMLRGDVPVSNETAAYLFAADRNEHVNGSLVTDGDRHLITGIREACAQGHTVVSDRYLFSSLAYQSIGCDPELPRRLNSAFPLPSLLFYFAIAPETALARIQGRGVQEIYEKQPFLERTVQEYRRAIGEFAGSGMKTIELDATRSIEETAAIIWKEIEARQAEPAPQPGTEC